MGTVAVGWFSRQGSWHAEWFRRVQWAQQLIAADDETAHVDGYQVLAYLGRSKLASKDDKQLVKQLAYDLELEQASTLDQQEVDSTEYLIDNHSSSSEESAGI